MQDRAHAQCTQLFCVDLEFAETVQRAALGEKAKS